ncbi:MAG TPA: RT0821/Lpp0805 family surface protein [Bauldia sp.]|nr:RT0821/Lpp0805 family surface protein [Bauldia sp.]
MSGHARSTGVALFRAGAVALLALALGGCSGLGLPFGERGTAGRMASAAAVQPILASAVITDQLDPSDWETIRRTIEGAPQVASRVDWQNAITGSVGSVELAADSDIGCRAFVATINDLHGIRRYRGGACEMKGGRLQLRGIVADDATLL